MVKVSRWKNTWRVFLLLAATSSASPAQTFTTLFNFTAANGAYPNGVVPQSALIQGTDGNLYGTTTTTVFKLTTTGTLTTLYTFNASDGSAPYGSLLQATDGNFYGTTTSGGASGDGTVFKITPAGEFTTLHSFDLADGSTPAGALIQGTDGNFYGTTSASASAKKSGPDKGNSTVFKIASTGELTTLYTFNNAGDGNLAYGALVQAADGNFYGTTGGGGGDNSFGTVYSITPTGTLTYLHRFTNTEGTVPTAGLVHAIDGNFYGTTSNGGDSGFGTVFKMTPAGAVTTLHSFNGIDGFAPLASLIQATDGNFYGTTFSCTVAANCGGTVFQINAMGSLTTLHTFTTDGAGSLGALFQASDGNLYGTTSGGGLGSAGTIFRISLSSGPAAVSSAPSMSMTIGGIVPNTIQPGEEILIYGANLATGTEVSTGASSPSLAGTSVTIDGQAASLLFVSPGQIALEVPNDTATGIVPVTVTTPSGSATFTVVLAQFAP